MKPTLRVIEGKGAGTGHPAPPAEGGFILPPVRLPDTEVFSTWLGMTMRQAELGFWAAAPERAGPSLKRVGNAIHEMEAALTEHRQVVLTGMMRRYPKAARRIMKAAAAKK